MTLNGQSPVQKRWLKKLIIPLLTSILVIAITVTIFILKDRIIEFREFGYFGAFLISLLSTASIFLPSPGLLLLIPLGTTLNPFLIGLVGAVGGTLGEITGYILGYSGSIHIQNNKIYNRAEGWMGKKGFLAVFLFSLLPFLPIDIISIVAGVFRFSIWKFLLACFLGKVILYLAMVLGGAWGLEVLLRYIGWSIP